MNAQVETRLAVPSAGVERRVPRPPARSTAEKSGRAGPARSEAEGTPGPPQPPAGNHVAAFRRALLGWYDRHRRDLPWRKSRNPYHVWLSEIMLQQTRVAAILEHYRVFLERFPNVEALAAAPLDAVLAAWSGLGYYRRARMLHQGARKIVEEHGGHLPPSSAALCALPGIGRYTAAAIASIAFNEPVAVVDGNVERVIERLSGRKLAQPKIWQQAQSLLHPGRPGDFNQAMMELGATVCLPRAPKCPICPLRRWCLAQNRLRHPTMERQAPSPARRLEQVSTRPSKIERPSSLRLRSGQASPARTWKKKSTRQLKKEIWCILDERDGRLRLVQRPQKSSLMPGMWELPQPSPSPGQTLNPWRTFRHSITVTDYTVHVLRDRSPAKGRWIPIASIPGLPITGLTRKILRAGGII